MKATQLKTLPSNEIFQQLKAELQGWHIKSTAKAADVTQSTLYFWLDGTTRLPRLDTIVKVANAIGLELKLVRGARAKLRLVK